MAEAEMRETVHTEITLKLTAEEAGTLLALTSAVSGDEDSSPRGVSRAVWFALSDLRNCNDQVTDAYNRARRLMRRRGGTSVGIHFESDAQRG